MRIFYSILLATWLVPQLVFGQSERAMRLAERASPSLEMFREPGTFEFTDGTKGEGVLAYHIGVIPRLLITTGAGQMMYSPYQIRSFSFKGHQFTTADAFAVTATSDFDITLGLLSLDRTREFIKRDFVEIIELGKLELLIHYAYFLRQHSTSHGPGITPSHYYTIPLKKKSYLLRQQGQRTPSVVLASSGESDKKLREALSPYFQDRPDLRQALKEKLITYENLPAYIRAYNTGSTL